MKSTVKQYLKLTTGLILIYIFKNYFFFRGEFYLNDYIQKIGNYNSDAIQSIGNTEGYFDFYNTNQTTLKANANLVAKRRKGAYEDGNNFRYEFILSPSNGFLQNLEPLVKDCELKIRLERAPWNVAIAAVADDPADMDSIELKDVYAVSEYISSPKWRKHFDKINTSPILYEYQESEAIVKSLPQNETEIRLDGIKGGNLPTYLFAGIIPQSSLNGDKDHSSTAFHSYGVREFNITLNGNSVNGFPMTIKNDCPIWPLHKFFDTTNRLANVYAGENMTQSDFKVNWIWSHQFECEQASQGWLGINMKLKQAFNEPMSLVVWLINPTAISIDKFHQIEKINL